ncbi:hypothetical protein ABK040_016007 [Willaertia magna]
MSAVPSPFVWDQTFCVANDEINGQHKRLFELIDALDKNRTCAQTLKDLLDLVTVHFKTEEDKFAQVGWENAKAHKEVHDKFVQDALAVKVVDDAVITFLKEWLVHHIQGEDMKYKGKL